VLGLITGSNLTAKHYLGWVFGNMEIEVDLRKEGAPKKF
jgi:hypothetical protein